MKYRFLKDLEENFEINQEFNLDWDLYVQNNWLKISIKELIKQWYIKEVEKQEPKFRIWDYAVDINNWFMLKIFSIDIEKEMYNIVYTGQGYFWLDEDLIRKPTKEELKKYFR